MITLKNKYLNSFFIIIFLFSFLIFCTPSLSAEGQYYANVTIDVDESGFVTLDGETNYPNLLLRDTEIYTSKKQSYWLLNITKEEIFSNFAYVLSLPAGSSINYVKSSGFFIIETSNGNLIVRGFGENEPLSILLQYQIKKTDETNTILNFDIMFILLICIIILVVITFILFLIKSKNEKKPTENKEESSFEIYNFKGLNDRQKRIMKLLIERKRPLTQTDIQKELNIPKAAVSRNIRGLEIKGLIEKEQIGMSNLIRLKKP